MKIIVDEIPKESKDCIFSEHWSTGWICGLHQGRGCEPERCNKLKPITDFHAEKVIEKYNDGSCAIQQFDIQ